MRNNPRQKSIKNLVALMGLFLAIQEVRPLAFNRIGDDDMFLGQVDEISSDISGEDAQVNIYPISNSQNIEYPCKCIRFDSKKALIISHANPTAKYCSILGF